MDKTKEIVSYLGAGDFNSKRYDPNAKTLYNENDVKAFAHNWYARFDHQSDIGFSKDSGLKSEEGHTFILREGLGKG